MDVSFYAEEISAIVSLSENLIKTKEKLKLLDRSINSSQDAIKSSKADLAKNTEYRKMYKPCTPEEESTLKATVSELERQMSALKIFDIKKRKELKEKISAFKAQQQKASIYLYYCKEISKSEKIIAENEQNYIASVKNKDSLSKEIELFENELSTRTEAMLAAIKKSKVKAADIAKAITCPLSALPSPLLNVLVTDAKSPLLSDLPIDKQIKLLWNRDTPLSFGGMEWNVVEIERNRARLILRGTVYDGIGFSETKKGGWDNSYGRKKLNGEFFDKFTDAEKSFIIPNDKAFNDKFTILCKEDIDNYLDNYQRNVPTNWWTSSSYIDNYSDDKERCVYYWDSFYEGKCRTFSDPISIAYSDAHYGNKHIIGYRPVVLVKINEDSNDISWANLWKSTAESSILCRGKWTSSNNYTAPYVKFSVSDMQRIMQNAGSGSSAPQRSKLDDFNSNGTPSGHGGRFG